MGADEARAKGLQLVPTWWPIATAFISAVFAIGAAHATNSLRNDGQDVRMDAQDRRIDKLESIDRRLSRIEGKLGLGGN